MSDDRVSKLQQNAQEILKKNLRAENKIRVKKIISALMTLAEPGFKAIKKILKNRNCSSLIAKWTVAEFKLIEDTERTQMGKLFSAGKQISYSKELMDKLGISAADMIEYCKNNPEFATITHSFMAEINPAVDALWFTIVTLTPKNDKYANFFKKFQDEVEAILQKTEEVPASPAQNSMYNTLNELAKLVKRVDTTKTPIILFKEMTSKLDTLPDPECEKLKQLIIEQQKTLFSKIIETSLATCESVLRNQYEVIPEEGSLILKEEIAKLTLISTPESDDALKKLLNDKRVPVEYRKWAVLQYKLYETAVKKTPNIQQKEAKLEQDEFLFGLSDSLMILFNISPLDMISYCSQPGEFQTDQNIQDIRKVFLAETFPKAGARDYGNNASVASSLYYDLENLKSKLDALPSNEQKFFSEQIYGSVLQILLKNNQSGSSNQNKILSTLKNLIPLIESYSATDTAQKRLPILKRMILESSALFAYPECQALKNLVLHQEKQIIEDQLKSSLGKIESILQSISSKIGGVPIDENIYQTQKQQLSPLARQLQQEITNLSFCSDKGFQAIQNLLESPHCPHWLRKWAIVQYMIVEKEGFSSQVESFAPEIKEEFGSTVPRSKQLWKKYSEITAEKLAGFCLQLSAPDTIYKDLIALEIQDKETSWSPQAKKLTAALRGLRSLTETSEEKKQTNTHKMSFVQRFYSIANGIIESPEGRAQKFILGKLQTLTDLITTYYTTPYTDKEQDKRVLEEIFRIVSQIERNQLTGPLIGYMAEYQQEIHEKEIVSKKADILTTITKLKEQQAKIDKELNENFLTPLITEILAIKNKNKTMSANTTEGLFLLCNAALSFVSEKTTGEQQATAIQKMEQANGLLKNKKIGKLGIALQEMIQGHRADFEEASAGIENPYIIAVTKRINAPSLLELQTGKKLIDLYISMVKATEQKPFYREIVNAVVKQRLNALGSQVSGTLQELFNNVRRTNEQQESKHESELISSESTFLTEVQSLFYEVLDSSDKKTLTKIEELYDTVTLYSNSSPGKARRELVLKIYKISMELEQVPHCKSLADSLLQEVDRELSRELERSKKTFQRIKSQFESGGKVYNELDASQKRTFDTLSHFMRALELKEASMRTSDTKFTIQEVNLVRKLLNSLLILYLNPNRNVQELIFQTYQKYFKDRLPDTLKNTQELIDIVEAFSKPERPAVTYNMEKIEVDFAYLKEQQQHYRDNPDLYPFLSNLINKIEQKLSNISTQEIPSFAKFTDDLVVFFSAPGKDKQDVIFKDVISSIKPFTKFFPNLEQNFTSLIKNIEDHFVEKISRQLTHQIEFFKVYKQLNLNLETKIAIGELVDSLLDIQMTKKKSPFCKQILYAIVEHRIEAVSHINIPEIKSISSEVRQALQQLSVKSTQPPGSKLFHSQVSMRRGSDEFKISSGTSSLASLSLESKEPKPHSHFLYEVQKEMYKIIDTLKPELQKEMNTFYTQIMNYANAEDGDHRKNRNIMYNAYKKLKERKIPQIKNLLTRVSTEVSRDATAELSKAVRQFKEMRKKLQAEEKAEIKNEVKQSPQRKEFTRICNTFSRECLRLSESIERTGIPYSIPELREIRRLIDFLIELGEATEESYPEVQNKIHHELKRYELIEKEKTPGFTFNMFKPADTKYKRIQALIDLVDSATKPYAPIQELRQQGQT